MQLSALPVLMDFMSTALRFSTATPASTAKRNSVKDFDIELEQKTIERNED